MDEQRCLDGLEDDRTIFRRPKDRDNPYVMIAKEAVFDRRVGISARLLLTAMLCQPDDWDFNVRHLAKELGVGRSQVAVWMNELVRAGYVVREQSRRRGGRFGTARYLVFERPTVSGNTVHGPTVSGDTVHGVSGHTNTPDPETEYRERESTPPPSATPKAEAEEQEPPADDSYREATEQVGYEHLKARGRPPGFSAKDERGLVEIIRNHGPPAVLAAFRRFLATTPQDKDAHWFIQDWESRWQPPRRPKPRQRRCADCGAVLVGYTCLACGAAPGEPAAPRVTPEEAQALVVKR